MTSDSTDRGEFVPVIGLEIHAQLLTSSKMFCSCSASYAGADPNTLVCPVCLGLPGSLPVINERALDQGIMVGLALNCNISPVTRFDRKNYPYPDIPKGYQISQYDNPLASDGKISIEVAGRDQEIGIIRAHLEEDTGKTIHATSDGREVSLVDYNRSGVPLLEIVSHPDIHSPESARVYFSALREILVFLGVNSGDMQEGALRADVNVSVGRRWGQRGTKVEIKNLNSFRAVERSLEYEISRQIDCLTAGTNVLQETRGWDESQEITVAQRSKEVAEDYRYFPEPDLPALNLSPELIAGVASRMPELASAQRKRFVNEYGLSSYDAAVLTQDPSLAGLMDATIKAGPFSRPKVAANWLTGELLRLTNESGTPVGSTRITADLLVGLLRLIAEGTITNAIAKTVFEEMFRSGRSAEAIVSERGLAQIADRDELRDVVQRVLDEQPALAKQYVQNERKTEGPLVGQVMKATRGQANAATVKEIIAEILLGES